MDVSELLDLAVKDGPKSKINNNVQSFINFTEMVPSENRVPFYIIYWLYRKWCKQNEVKKTKIVSKHVLSKTLGLFFNKKSTYPKTKKYGVRIDYQMVVYVDSPYLPFSTEEEEIAFKYYHYQYAQDRAKRKRKPWTAQRKKHQKENEQSTQD
jgi:hypothetical protein